MPLNSIPATTTVDALRRQAAARRKGSASSTSASGAASMPGNEPDLAALARRGRARVQGVSRSSRASTSFPRCQKRDLRVTLPTLARIGATLLVHAEVPGPLDAAGNTDAHAHPRSLFTYLASRPKAEEDEAIALLIRLCVAYRRPHAHRAPVVREFGGSRLPLRAPHGLPL